MGWAARLNHEKRKVVNQVPSNVKDDKTIQCPHCTNMDPSMIELTNKIGKNSIYRCEVCSKQFIITTGD